MPLATYWPDLALKWLQSNLEDYLFTGDFNAGLNALMNPDDDPSEPAGSAILGSLQDNPTRAGVVVEIYENDPDDESWSHEIYQDTRDGNRRYSDSIGRARNYWNRRYTLKVVVFFRGTDRATASAIRGAVNYRIEELLLSRPTMDEITDTGGEKAKFGHIIRENGREGGQKSSPFWRSKLWLEFRTLRRA